MATERLGSAVLNDAFEELALGVGGVVASHAIPDDAVWDLARVVDHVYRKARAALSAFPTIPNESTGERRDGMHPAIARLVTQLRADTEPL